MWMLLTAQRMGDRGRAPVAGGLQAVVAAGEPEWAKDIPGPRIGRIRPVSNGSRLNARVFLHPGRALVAVMSIDQLCEQFDMASAIAFDSIGRAELAADGRAGFVVQVDGPFVDQQGVQREQTTALFISGLEKH